MRTDGEAPGSGWTVAAVVLVFGALWLPLGQQAFVYGEWPQFALGGALFGLLAVSVAWGSGTRRPERLILLAILAVYMLHQFEEHGVDLEGRYFAFEATINGIFGPLLGCPANLPCPFDPQTLFLVNSILVWWLIASVAAAGAGYGFADLMAVSIMTVNAATHIGAALTTGAYNPGLGSAVLLFLPVGIAATVWIVRRFAVPAWQVVASLLYGAALHATLALGIVAHQRGWIGAFGYGVLLFAAASIPAALTLRRARP